MVVEDDVEVVQEEVEVVEAVEAVELVVVTVLTVLAVVDVELDVEVEEVVVDIRLIRLWL